MAAARGPTIRIDKMHMPNVSSTRADRIGDVDAAVVVDVTTLKRLIDDQEVIDIECRRVATDQLNQVSRVAAKFPRLRDDAAGVGTRSIVDRGAVERRGLLPDEARVTTEIVERLSGKKSLFAGLPAFLQVALTFVLVIFGWILFRAESLPHAFEYAGTMIGVGAASADLSLPHQSLDYAMFGVGLLIIWAFPTTQTFARTRPLAWILIVQALFLAAVIVLHNASNVPFLYFQF